MRQMKQAHIKKPLPVKVVEALGWAYVALSVFPLVACSLFEFFWLLLSLGMVLGLRRGRRALFLSLHAIILSLVALCCVASLLHGTEPQVTWVLVLLLLLVAPVILLCLPSSNLWFKEKLGGKAEPKGFLVCMILVLILILAALIPELICGVVIRRGNAKRGLSMTARCRAYCEKQICSLEVHLPQRHPQAWPRHLFPDPDRPCGSCRIRRGEMI
jgi:hypothetical protein